jgi:hypothetical protein
MILPAALKSYHHRCKRLNPKPRRAYRCPATDALLPQAAAEARKHAGRAYQRQPYGSAHRSQQLTSRTVPQSFATLRPLSVLTVGPSLSPQESGSTSHPNPTLTPHKTPSITPQLFVLAWFRQYDELAATGRALLLSPTDLVCRVLVKGKIKVSKKQKDPAARELIHLPNRVSFS